MELHIKGKTVQIPETFKLLDASMCRYYRDSKCFGPTVCDLAVWPSIHVSVPYDESAERAAEQGVKCGFGVCVCIV